MGGGRQSTRTHPSATNGQVEECENSFQEGIPRAPGPVSCLHGDLWALGLFAEDQEEAGAAVPAGFLPCWMKASVSLFVKWPDPPKEWGPCRLAPRPVVSSGGLFGRPPSTRESQLQACFQGQSMCPLTPPIPASQPAFCPVIVFSPWSRSP